MIYSQSKLYLNTFLITKEWSGHGNGSLGKARENWLVKFVLWPPHVSWCAHHTDNNDKKTIYHSFALCLVSFVSSDQIPPASPQGWPRPILAWAKYSRYEVSHTKSVSRRKSHCSLPFWGWGKKPKQKPKGCLNVRPYWLHIWPMVSCAQHKQQMV